MEASNESSTQGLLARVARRTYFPPTIMLLETMSRGVALVLQMNPHRGLLRMYAGSTSVPRK